MKLSPRYLIKILEQNGFTLKRVKGSHHLYYNSGNKKTVIVPFHGGKDLKKGTFIAILKQAGIEKPF
jgi:predicted RNA binding protein YcfA (HicA-like mRNA interferase family)